MWCPRPSSHGDSQRCVGLFRTADGGAAFRVVLRWYGDGSPSLAGFPCGSTAFPLPLPVVPPPSHCRPALPTKTVPETVPNRLTAAGYAVSHRCALPQGTPKSTSTQHRVFA